MEAVALLSYGSKSIIHYQIKSFLMPVMHAVSLSTHANECCSLKEVFHSLWHDDYASFAVNKVTAGTKWNVMIVIIHSASWVFTYSNCKDSWECSSHKDGEANADKQETSRWETHSETCRKIHTDLPLPQHPAASLCLGIHFHTFRGYLTTPLSGVKC